MAFGKTGTHRHTPPRRDYIPPLPHRSWRLSAASSGPDTPRLTSARDFWDRLDNQAADDPS